MANTVYERGFTGNKEIYKIAQSVFWEGLRSMIWHPFIGRTTPDGRMIKPMEDVASPVENPIVMHRELLTGTRQQGSDIIRVPTIRRLRNMPKVGPEQLKDREEELKVNHMEVAVDTMRHAVKPRDGKMMDKRTGPLQLIRNSRPSLQAHYSESLEFLGPSYALYYGYSRNILVNSSWSGHSYVKTISHPNIFTIGGGRVAAGTTDYPSSAAYETAVSNAIANVGASDQITMSALRGLKAHPKIRRIKPLQMVGGQPVRLLFLHPYQLATLEADGEFQTSQARIISSTERLVSKNPMITAASYVTEGFAIFQSDTAVWPCRDSSGTPEFGPSGINAAAFSNDFDAFEDYTSDTVFAGFILGSNAVGMAVGSGLEFEERRDDYEHLVGVAWDIIIGFARGDSWNRDDGTLGQHVINDGSALLISYAPAPDIA